MHISSEIREAQITCQPGFAWDRQDAYLFDIDGTLLRSRDRVHIESFLQGVQEVTGMPVTLEGVPLAGNTDTAILRDACQRSGISVDVLEPQVEAILEAMCSIVAARRGDLDLVLMPAVEDTLRHLHQRGALLGVATGNLEAIGWIKMEQAGLRPWFLFGGFSDRFPLRSALVGHAAGQARQLAGSAASVCVVGDTPRDIEAAHANGLAVIAVATGHFSFHDLLAHQPEVCATSLAALLALVQEAA
ncbi:MAG TPA: HAD hydrolase-like protein [Terracidiphilus sp.]|nr:HAD hydrolase-like protein [Terracidiphilus sp.]